MQINTSKNTLLAFIAVPIIIAIIMASAVLVTTVGNDLQRKTEANVKAHLQVEAQKLTGFFAQYGLLNKRFVHDPELLQWFENHSARGADLSNDPGYNRVNQKFIHLSSNDNIISAFFAPDTTAEYFRENQVVGAATHDQELDYYANRRPWYIATVHGGHFYLGSPSTDFSTGRSSSVIQGPVYTDDQKLIGVGGIDLNLKAVNQMVDSIHYENQGFGFLLDGNANVVHFPSAGKRGEFTITTPRIDGDGTVYKDNNGNSDLITTKVYPNHPITAFDSHDTTSGFTELSKRFETHKSGIDSVMFMGEKYYLAYQPVALETPRMNWTLGLMIPANVVEASPIQLATYTVMGVAVLIVFIVGLIIFAPLSTTRQ